MTVKKRPAPSKDYTEEASAAGPSSAALGPLSHVSGSANPGEIIEPHLHARQHAHVRRAHQTELVEDYVELIADLIDAKGEARGVEIAQRMDVKQATVGKMIGRLRDMGLVTSEPYRAVFLTEDGRAMADASRRRHAIVLRFLLAIGVSERTAMKDAEGIEHHVSSETLDAFEALAERLERQSEAPQSPRGSDSDRT